MALAERYNWGSGQADKRNSKKISYRFHGIDDKYRRVLHVRKTDGTWEGIPETSFPDADQYAPDSIADIRALRLAKSVLDKILKKGPKEQRFAVIDARFLFVFAGLSGDSESPKARFATINLKSGLRSHTVELSAMEIRGRLDDGLTPKRHRAEYRAALEALDAAAPTPAPRSLSRPVLEAV